MPDDYYQRYNRFTHDQLYRLLQQGSPATVARQADAWRQAGQTAATLASHLRRDLIRMSAQWTGLGSDEFDIRITMVVNFARKLADEAASIGVGTEALSRALAEAQRHADPNPAGPVAGSDPATLRIALRNAASGWTPEAVLGTDLGHVPVPAEQSAAHERMVTLVAELAALYGVVDQANWPRVIPDAPAGMPGTGTAVADPVVVDATAGLAGAGAAGPMLGSGGLAGGLNVPTGSIPGGGPVAPGPAAMLAGGGPGLAGAARPAVNTSSAGASATGTSAMPPMAGAPMMMAGGHVIGQQPGGSVEAAIGDGADAWTGHGSTWVTAGGDGSEPPGTVVGELA
jgi:hypothetical protein